MASHMPNLALFAGTNEPACATASGGPVASTVDLPAMLGPVMIQDAAVASVARDVAGNVLPGPKSCSSMGWRASEIMVTRSAVISGRT